MTDFIQTLKKRRSIYALGKNVTLNEANIEGVIVQAVQETPSAFNSQSSRIVILFNQAHDRLWAITEAALRAKVAADQFAPTAEKLARFKAAKGTVLFFEDQSVVDALQAQFPAYADHFPLWSEQASGMAQHSVWVALNEQNIGASLQHYNPLIDHDVNIEWALPDSWRLRAQMPFGSIEAEAAEKTYVAADARFRVFK
ncbi:MAG: nitroreductase family protein [Neisseriaceae bacterium]|nr:nitroreductase family protein [Neisseriaceae bacterium]